MADNACFGVHGSGYGSQLTYQAGCTDPDYKDKSCPDKKGIDQPWIALTRCDDDEGVWGACSQEGNPSTLQPGSFCSCTEVAKFTPTAFSDAATLALFASLPTGTGESIKFETGHVPSGDPTSDSSPAETGSASAGASGTSGGGSSASQTGSQTGAGSATQGGSASGSGRSATASRTGSTSSGTSTSGSGSNNGGSNNGGSNNGGSNNGGSSDGSSGLASGAKIGIGVGITVAVLLLIAIIAAFLLRRRKRRQSQAAATATEVEKGDKKDAPLTNGAAAGRTSNLSAADPRISDVTGGTETTNKMSEADGKPLSGADKPGVTELDSGAVMEVSGQTAQPWDRGAELDGRPLRKPSSPKELPGSLAAESPPSWVVR
ncbi:uncharacterized protein N0V89_011750 [Didymosphaeria variabile]|uniref:Uncharacterized protein n=1 Tax=Didymosphaeria variabile TaxID=1932322 RepID=A0A9W9C516_9PLEO|nr:uncharacterized protein N0V89_011750 [Didymosphaeria variabile]KAJ4345616.1 hypothetical protein N0V89_011750 [Didymosphaeria variabile]